MVISKRTTMVIHKINPELFKKKPMEQLIKITTNEQGSQVVSAKELHKYLEVGTGMVLWVQRCIDKYGFEEGKEYIAFKTERSDNKQIVISDFAVTLDMAKELAMVTETTKGKEARKYFIECEKKLQSIFKVPQTFREALLLAAEQQEKIEEQQRLLLEQAPKVDFYDVVTGSDDAIDIGSASKVLKLKYGRTTLFAKLRELGILMAKNEPYQKYIDKEYFRVIEVSYTRSSGTFIHLKTMVTQKGLDFIRKKLAE